MNNIIPAIRYCGTLVAAVACAAVLALRPPQQQEQADTRGTPLEAAYLDCARVAAASLREPDLVTLCSVVADALLQRGFGTELERQLQWWKTPEPAGGASQYPPAFQHPGTQAAR